MSPLHLHSPRVGPNDGATTDPSGASTPHCPNPSPNDEVIRQLQQQLASQSQQVAQLTDALQRILTMQAATQPPATHAWLPTAPVIPTAQSADERQAERSNKIMVNAFQNCISKYQGQKDGRVIDDFLQSYESYVGTAGLTDTQAIDLLAIYLEKAASTWYKYFRDTQFHLLPADQYGQRWPGVKAALRREFLPPTYEVTQWKRFHELDTRKGLTNFVHQFRRYIMSMPSLSEEDFMRTLEGKLDADAYTYLRC